MLFRIVFQVIIMLVCSFGREGYPTRIVKFRKAKQYICRAKAARFFGYFVQASTLLTFVKAKKLLIIICHKQESFKQFIVSNKEKFLCTEVVAKLCDKFRVSLKFWRKLRMNGSFHHKNLLWVAFLIGVSYSSMMIELLHSAFQHLIEAFQGNR